MPRPLSKAQARLKPRLDHLHTAAMAMQTPPVSPTKRRRPAARVSELDGLALLAESAVRIGQAPVGGDRAVQERQASRGLHTLKERERRVMIRDLFVRLTETLPADKRKQSTSDREVLEAAHAYIEELKEEGAALRRSLAELRLRTPRRG